MLALPHRRPFLLTLAAAFALAACGDNLVGAIPDSGVHADATVSPDAGEDPNAYPPGPYGAFTGDTIPNLAFDGYVTFGPSAGPVEDEEFRTGFTLQDIREHGGFRFLLFNVAAEWCTGCRIEAQQLPDRFREWGENGGFVLSVIIEDTAGRTAQTRHLDAWLATYNINYSMVHDPAASVNTQLGPESLPMNLIIDLETMEILTRRIGEDLTIFEAFEDLL